MPVEELTDEELDHAFAELQKMRDTMAEIERRLTALEERTKPA